MIILRAIGNENIFIVSILDASLLQTEFENTQAKNFDEKINYKYELFYLIEFNLLDDSRNLIATTLVETSRSTTSGIYISINEKENIINDLIYQSLNDLSYESETLLKNIWMSIFYNYFFQKFLENKTKIVNISNLPINIVNAKTHFPISLISVSFHWDL